MNAGKKYIFFVLLFLHQNIIAQDNLFARFTTKENQEKIYKNLINNTINKNLSLPLNDSTEANWEDAFGALEVRLYRNKIVDKKIDEAFEIVGATSKSFQRALLELAYTNYPSKYFIEALTLLQNTADIKIFAMCVEYLLQQNPDRLIITGIEDMMTRKFPDRSVDPVIAMLSEHISEIKKPSASFIENKFFTDILNKKFLQGNIIMYSFQRKERDYPGLVVIRNREGSFIRDSGDIIFNVPQLARSISNLPGYLTNGNTPQGIFRMHGFDVSTSIFIGPSPNIQLFMPGETSLKKFFNDSTIEDSIWTKEYYSKLLPPSLQNYAPLYHTYYAGIAGRTEIISHGTTINPEYYKGKPYYPHTPTQGCLCTKEIWDGKRLESNQVKLINALLKAGGAEGYCVVVEIDDKKTPVTIDEILPALLKAESLK
ncbi:MAG: hypothetical protein JWO92_1071 [Chitinophagaceae bacterium]|nr:hypothetical protein [Chitinophagaceae bacterium]